MLGNAFANGLWKRSGKDIENRTWWTAERGRVKIHAGKKLDDSRDWIEGNFGVTIPKELPLGGIVGSVEIVDCVKQSASPWFFGPYGFVLRNPVVLPFVPMRGQLGFFEADTPIIESSSMNTTPPRYTVGGYLESEAWAWDNEAFQALGSVVFNLASGKPDLLRKALANFLELRRHFMADVFDQYVDALEELRRESGHRGIREQIDEVREALIERKKPDPKPAEQPFMASVHELATLTVETTPAPQPVDVRGEQLSLF